MIWLRLKNIDVIRMIFGIEWILDNHMIDIIVPIQFWSDIGKKKCYGIMNEPGKWYIQLPVDDLLMET